MRALVVEDDADVAADLGQGLQNAGFVVDIAREGEDAWFKGNVEDYDVAVLDLGLPRMDGLSVLKRWRDAQRTFPVLILSARNDWTEKVAGIESGADDYLGKPFEMAELIARVRALVRRAAGHASSVIEIGRLALDTRRMSASYAGRPIRLSQLEFRFLDYLAHQRGRAVSSGELAEHLYGAAEPGDSNAIEALVVRLRRKIGPEVIETRRGFGYVLAGGST
ncbi:transcriptional regulator [Steroidobacter denitrificans]|uniref:Transcriptional regulator n=1 Tax=Steroidobacter denitrificans TaxID=465721 RepID=A0A127F8P4_STEDE|nr:response regulator transcription factor [Steroidobacter denitrificans]AMN45909.1 transcriptional regulator [Steroidobacter denitrificans]